MLAGALETWKLLRSRLLHWKGVKNATFFLILSHRWWKSHTKPEHQGHSVQAATLLSHLLPFIPPTFCFISNTSNWSNWELRNPLIYDQASNLQLGQSPTLTTVPGLGLNPGSEGKARALPPTWSRQGERSLQAVMMDAKSQHSQARVGEPTAGCSFRGTPVHLKRAIQLMFYFGRLLNCFCQGDLPHCFITW